MSIFLRRLPDSVTFHGTCGAAPALSSGRFRFDTPTDGGAVGAVVRFVEESGRPMRLYTGGSWIDRVP